MDKQWVEEELQRIERKREMLAMLENCLGDWEREIKDVDLPPEKLQSFKRLTESSIATLESLINRLNVEIRTGLTEIVARKHQGGA